jgi:alpha-glucoside transport system substrate-binding protein
MRWRAPSVAVVVAILSVACVSAGERSEIDSGTVEVFGPYRGAEADRFADVLARFEGRSGIAVRYVGSVDFVTDLRRRIGDVNDPPDIAMVPQPGLVRELAAEGEIVALGPGVEDVIATNYSAAGAALGTIQDTLYGVPYRVVVKSLIWYRPEVFSTFGWGIPRTLDELDALVDRIEAESDLSPWCLGIEAGSATGWVATDWVEDLVLRLAGAEAYREWVTGQLAFADSEIADAFSRFRSLALAPGRVLGGARAVVETPAREAVIPLLDDPPGCALHKQADFVVGWMPDSTTIGTDRDVDFFVMPGPDASTGAQIVVGGDLAVQFRSSPEVDVLMSYLADPEAGEIWAREGGFISANSTVPDDVYPDDYLQTLAQALEGASALVFDASDQMPADIGAGLLWDDITAWITGSLDYATMANRLDEARNESIDDP